MYVDSTRTLTSIGRLATLLHLPVPTIYEYLDRIGAEPKLILNDVPYFDQVTLDQLRDVTAPIPNSARVAEPKENS